MLHKILLSNTKDRKIHDSCGNLTWTTVRLLFSFVAIGGWVQQQQRITMAPKAETEPLVDKNGTKTDEEVEHFRRLKAYQP